MSYYDIIEVTCPDCGGARWVEEHGRGAIRKCRPCSFSATRKIKKWASHGTLHGESKFPLYRVWSAMKQRCDMPTDHSFSRYGGRGISYCDEWKEYLPFRDWALANSYRKGLLLDRRDNDGNYTPDNCRWVISAISSFNRPEVKLKPAAIAVIRELASWGLPSILVAALYKIDPRRVPEIRDRKKFKWIEPTMNAGW